MSLFVQESWVNATERWGCGDSDVYESFADEVGELFKHGQREHGRCTGKVYVDGSEGVKAVGWVFEKRVKYEDSDDTFLLETWVTVHREQPTKTVEYHYVGVGSA